MRATRARVADASEKEAVTAILMLAFATDPPTRWLFPKARDFVALYPRFAAAFGGRAFEHDTAFITDDGAAAALWLPPGTAPDGDTLGAIIQEAMAASGRQPDGEIGERMAAYHPTEPHWYLPLIGVDPARQGRGLGSALLTHALALVDADRSVAYLESSNIKNVPLYERFGFEVLGVIEGPDFPPLYPMLRPAKS
jgi:ribosomal protein S18 acetylase RimI-like enzyme